MGDSACNQAPVCNHLLLLFICNFYRGTELLPELQTSTLGAEEVWYEGGGDARKGVLPQAFPDVSLSDAKDDTSLTGASGTNCQLQQIVGHFVEQNPLFLSLRAWWSSTHVDPYHDTCVGVKQVPFYASLTYGVDFAMREWDRTRSSASQAAYSDREYINSRSAAGPPKATRLRLACAILVK